VDCVALTVGSSPVVTLRFFNLTALAWRITKAGHSDKYHVVVVKLHALAT
jgi:hypothetical protein